jgi:carbon monoxide dehydrogenase subunit G
MRIQESGTFEVLAATDDVTALVANPEFLGKTLPDSTGYEVTGPDSCVVKLKVGVSHIKGVMPAVLTIHPADRADRLSIGVKAQGLGSRVDMQLAFAIQPSNGGTQVSWTSDATVSGVLASVGAGLLRPLAKKNFDAIVTAIQTAIASTAQADKPSP